MTPTLRWFDSGVWAFVDLDDPATVYAMIVGEHGDWMLRERAKGIAGPFRTINEAAAAFWRRHGHDPIAALTLRDALTVVRTSTAAVIERLQAQAPTDPLRRQGVATKRP